MFNKGMSYHSPPSSWTETKIIKWRVLNDQTCPYLYINIMIIGIYKNIAGTYYFKTLPKYCFCFNLKKNSTVYQGVRRHCINYFWVINELYCAVALRALNIADIKPKALHDP